eukprot:gene9221-12434_t
MSLKVCNSTQYATFNYVSTTYQSWTVPANVYTINVDAAGASGGNGAATGGSGARVQTNLIVTPGQTLYIYIGKQGSSTITTSGTFGGGGGSGASGGRQGGGATDIRSTAGDLSTRYVVAGGGGGSYGNTCNSNGGDGGETGESPANSLSSPCSVSTVPTGGTSSGGGSRGISSTGGVAGDGTLGNGGNGGGTYGGGGGGGYYGGGGGSTYGGGGGSSFASATDCTDTVFTTGYRTGDGIIYFQYEFVYPTVLPSPIPSSTPSRLPSCPPTISNPSVAPSITPTSNPTSNPSSSPSNQPTACPTNLPSCKPSVNPTAIPSICPSNHPTGPPSALPTTLPTLQPISVPSVPPTLSPSNRPSKQPASFPTNLPTSNPTLFPTEQPQSVPSVIPSDSPRIISIIANATIIDHHHFILANITLTTKNEVVVHCGTFMDNSYPTSLTDIAQQSFNSVNNMNYAVVFLSNLIPSTSYNLYCYTSTFSGTTTDFDVMMNNVLTVKTRCCKTLHVNSGYKYVYQSQTIQNLVAVSIDYPPSSSLLVDIKSFSGGLHNSLLYPNQVSFTRSSSVTDYAVTGYFQYSGSYKFEIILSGVSVDEYDVVFGNGNNLTVVSISANPIPPPKIIYCKFSDDGSYIDIEFDSFTDRGGFVNQFPCSDVFDFLDASSAVCQWYSDKNIHLHSVTSIGVNSTIVLASRNNIRAYCDLISYSSLCAKLSTISPQTMLVQSADNPVPPVVNVQIPSILSRCSDLAVDFSGSMGSGGRIWKYVNIDIFGSSSARIMDYLKGIAINNTYSVTIPSIYFSSDSSYKVSLTLCNFLGSCGSNSYLFTMSIFEDVPSISISGSQYKTAFVNKTFVLQTLLAEAACNTSNFPRKYTYVWNVKENSQQTSITSISMDQTKFKLPAYSLHPGKNYEFSVSVIPENSNRIATSTVYVSTSTSALVAMISGGDVRSIGLGEKLELDGSLSYDPDIPLDMSYDDQLQYDWSCYQLNPSLSQLCPFKIFNYSDTSSSKVMVISFKFNVTGRVILRVSDMSRARVSVAYVDITATDSTSTTISILTSGSLLTNIATNKQLLISGTVKTALPCDAKWVVDDQCFNLSAISVSPTRVSVAKSVIQQMNLVISPYSLPERSSLKFSLNCHDSFASITVTTNGSPQPGILIVNPKAGKELLTSFMYHAALWMDSDIPLSYQFGFESPSMYSRIPDTVVIQYKSQFSSSSSYLPAGRSTSNYRVNCFVQVFDSLDAFRNTSSSVVVAKVENLMETLSLNRTYSLLSKSNDVASITRTVSVIGTSMNNANCSAAPNCSLLHREECAFTDHTCGSCLYGYTGKIGDSNRKCFHFSPVRESGCHKKSDCTFEDECSSNGTCYSRLQSCSGLCKFHGRCEYQDLNTGAYVQSCTEIEESCNAVCVCEAGYTGYTCDITINAIEQRRAIRRILIDNLHNITKYDDLNEDSVVMWSSLLSIVSLVPYEVKINDLDVIITIANNILQAWTEVSTVSYEKVVSLLQAIDSIASIAAQSIEISAEHREAILSKRILLLNTFSSNVLNQMVPSQDKFSDFYASFRTSSQYSYITDFQSLTVPISQTESVLNVPVSSVSLNISNDVSLPGSVLKTSLISTTVSSFGSNISSTLIANPLQFSFSSSTPLSGNVVFELKNNFDVNYVDNKFNFTTVCNGTDFSVFTYHCPESGFSIIHNCSFHRGSFTSFCPINPPSCALLNTSSSNMFTINNITCTVLKYDSQSTTCSCPLVESNKRRNLLDNTITEIQSEIMSVAIISEFIGNDAKNTFSAAPGLFTVDGAKQVITILIMFASFWSVGLSLIFACSWRRQLMMKKNLNDDKLQDRVKKSAKVSRSPNAVKEYLLDYVNELFPSVFSKKSYLSRLSEEIKRHHRYIQVLTASSGEAGDSARILTGVQLLTIQTMLMFLLALLYDIQSPDDDGSCPSHLTRPICLTRRSALDSSQSYCKWQAPPYSRINANDDPLPYTCVYADPKFTFRVVIIIAVLVSLFTSLFSKPIDMIFDVLSAPTADTEKVQSEPSALQKVGRRVSTAARRVSVAAINLINTTADQIRQRGLSLVGSKTRQIPRTTQMAHEVAIASMSIISSKSKNTIQLAELRRRETFAKSMTDLRHTDKACQSDDESEDSSSSQSSDFSDNNQRISAAQSTSDSIMLRGEKNESIDQRFERLAKEIHFQRKLLKPYERDDFDIQWGVDPTGEFARSDFSLYNILWRSGRLSAMDRIKNEMRTVRNKASKCASKLRLATDSHIGLELLHLFIIDLLGRETPAARIFETKAEEDFKYVTVVRESSKRIAMLFLVIINLFFVFYAVLVGYVKGVA